MRLRQEDIDWVQKAVQQQMAVSKAIAHDIESLFYSRMNGYRDRGQDVQQAAQSALDAMNRDPWGARE